jgi:hypothetical protein
MTNKIQTFIELGDLIGLSLSVATAMKKTYGRLHIRALGAME